MKVLIIEDEKKVASFIRKGLESEGFIMDIVYDGERGLEKAYDDSYDLIILDLMLPKIDGLSLLKQIRRDGIATQVLILTAKGNVEDRIEGLNLGADDYLVKPFAFGELVARVRALLAPQSGLAADSSSGPSALYRATNSGWTAVANRLSNPYIRRRPAGARLRPRR